MRLYLYLPPELVLHIRLHQLLLVEDFQSDDELGFLLSCQVNVAELPSTQGLADLEVVDGPLLGLEFLGASG